MYIEVPQYKITFHGLKKWVERSVEKFGWISIAHCEGHKHKLGHFQKMLIHLHTALKQALENYQDPDKKYDIGIMIEKIEHLFKLVEIIGQSSKNTLFGGNK